MPNQIRAPAIRDVLYVQLPIRNPKGHEQEGKRPVVVVGEPHKAGAPRYPMLLVAPLTSQVLKWMQKAPQLYPVLPKGSGKLSKKSVVLLDNVQSLDMARVVGRFGTLKESEYQPIKQGLKLVQAL